MTNALAQLAQAYRAIFRHRWLGLIAAFAICAAGWSVVQNLPDKYRVSSQIQFDTETVLKPVLDGIAVDNPLREETALLVRRSLLTKDTLMKVVENSNVGSQTTSPAGKEQIGDK